MPKDNFFLLITIETLSKTTFDLIIHKEARIKDLKRQIRYYTHIPINEQHLLLGETELKDSYSLEDYRLVYGSRVKLVTGMRGGPISFRPASPPPPFISLMAFLKTKSNVAKKSSSTETISSSEGEYSELLGGDEADDIEDTAMAYFIAHEGRFLQITNFTTKSHSNELLQKIRRNTTESEAEKKDALKEAENAKMKEKMMNLKKKIDQTVADKEKLKSFKKTPQPQAPLEYFKRAKNKLLEDDPQPKEVLRAPNGVSSKKKDSIAIEKELFNNREKQQKEYKKSLVLLKSASNQGTLKENRKKRSVKLLQEPLDTADDAVVLADETPEKETTQARSISRKQMGKVSDVVAQEEEQEWVPEKVAENKDISMRSMSIKKMDILPKVNSRNKNSPTGSRYKTPVSVSHESISCTLPVRRSKEETTSQPTYTPGFKSSAFEDYVKSEEFSKQTESARPTKFSNKLASSHTYPHLAPKRVNKVEPELDSNVIWKGSTSSSKANIEDLMNFMRKNLEKKDKKASIRKITTSIPSQKLSFSKEPLIALPPISAKKATIHTSKISGVSVVKKEVLRCAVCQKRLKISEGYLCKCQLHFCAKHRYPEEHNCKFDYKKEGKEKINKENPKVEKEKVPKF